jgi:hypothetical protein
MGACQVPCPTRCEVSAAGPPHDEEDAHNVAA